MRTTLTAFVPAHKQTNPEHAPGQLINPVNPLGFVDKTLGDYIRRKDKIHEAFDAVQKEQKKECCGNPLRTGPDGRGCENCPPSEKISFVEWFEERTAEFDKGEPLTWRDLEVIAQQAWDASKEN